MYKSYINMLKNSLFTISLMVLLSSPLLSKTIIIDNTLRNRSIGLFIEYMEDFQGKTQIEDIIKKDRQLKWSYPEKEKPGFGFTNSIFWVKFSIENTAQDDIEFYLEEAYPLIDDIKLYIPGKDKTQVYEAGDTRPFNERPYIDRNFIFPLKLKSKATQNYYLRFQTTSSMNFALSLWSPEEFKNKTFNEYLLLVFYYGIIFVMIIYNFFIFLFSRKIEYLYYVLFVLFFILFIMTQNGTAFQFLWPTFPLWANFFIPLSLCFLLIFAILFSRNFLSMKELDKITNRITRILLYVSVVLTILCLFLRYNIAMVLSAATTGVAVSWAVFVGIRFTFKKSRNAYFYTLAWLAFLIGALAYLTKSFGILPTNFFTSWALQIGSATQVVLLSFGLADRINTMRKQLKVLNQNLEDKVKARTEELQSATEELEAMNESLLLINDELTQAHRAARFDMEMAANVQSTLFPKKAPRTDEWDTAFLFKPLDGVSGDMYDFYEMDGRLKGITLMDVSGHGIASGLITMIARSVFFRNFYKGENKELNEIAGEANRDLINEMGQVENYLTGILLRLKGNVVEYINAGHPDLLLKKSSTGSVTPVKHKDRDIKGFFLGIEHVNKPYEVLSFEIGCNDVMLLYTDCLYESKNSNGKEYSIENVIKSLSDAPDSSAEDILNKLMKDFYGFLGNRNPDDDLTVLVVKKKS